MLLELHAKNRSRLLSKRRDAHSSLAKLRRGKIEENQELSSSSLGPTLRSVGEVRSVGGISTQSGGITTAEENLRHAAAAFAASGRPTDIDAAILDEHSVLLSRLTEAVMRIQRVRRLGAFPRVARRLRHRQRAALFVQRVFRGYLGRR